jgi:radical SAM/Cys-rich protein
MLNKVGYGKVGTGLELNLVYNPIGASLPPPEDKLQSDYKRILFENFGIIFNSLYTITNLPISRFLEYLLTTGKFEEYMEKLVNSFNSDTIEGLMCRNTISVSWNGKLFDCDFNQMLELQTGNNSPKHISEFNVEKLKERNIVVNQHCYGCTAGAGSSCQGSIL